VALTARTRERALRAVLLAGSMGATLLALELAVRLLGLGPERFLMTARMANARWTALLDCYPTNPRGYFELDLRAPENREKYHAIAPLRYDTVARRAPWAVEFRYNAQRFRDVPLAPKTPGVKRIFVLGDSFTEGQGVKEADTCVRVLGRLLDERAPGRYEVRNCGRRGTDFPALFEAFELIEPYEPDLVVYALVLNDADQSDAFHARQSYVDDWIVDRARQVDETPAPPPFRLALLGFLSSRVDAWRVSRATTRWYLDMWGPANADGWARTQGYLREMDRRLRRRGGRLLVAPWPLLVGLDGRYPFAPVHETIRRFCLEAGLPHHDLLPLFAGRKPEPLWVHPVDRHPNETAHGLAARDLLPVVLDLTR
jgi:hypothetical protein